MPSKIETSLTPEQLQEFFLRCSQLRGTKLRDIQALADEFGVEISVESARSFRNGDGWQDYLDGLKRKRELAESVATIAQNGVALSDGAASKFAAKVFDAIDTLEVDEIGTKKGNAVSLAIARLRQGDQRAKKLESDLKLRDEQIAKLIAERDERDEKKRKLQESISAAKKKNGLTRETLEQIEQEAKLL
jgi:hypothetical protein